MTNKYLLNSRIESSRLTEVNGIPIPATPGTCYHAILCALSLYCDKLISWQRLFELTEKYMIQFGGHEAWNDFKNKKKSKCFKDRIKENIYALTRTGKQSYGYRLHQRGMCIYYFQDGAMLLTGGEFKKSGRKYDVKFSDGRCLQVRHRGSVLTNKQYKKCVESGVISPSGDILKPEEYKNIPNI